MSIQSILKSKNAKIDQLVKQFNTVYANMQPKIFKEVQSLFKAGIFNEQMIANVFTEAGFQDLYLGFIDEFGEMVRFGKKLSNELAIGYKLTDKNFGLLETLSLQIVSGGVMFRSQDMANQ